MDDPWGSPWNDELGSNSTAVGPRHGISADRGEVGEVVGESHLDWADDDGFGDWNSAVKAGDGDVDSHQEEDTYGNVNTAQDREEEENGVGYDEVRIGSSLETKASPETWAHTEPGHVSESRSSTTINTNGNIEDETSTSLDTSFEADSDKRDISGQADCYEVVSDSVSHKNRPFTRDIVEEDDSSAYGDFKEGEGTKVALVTDDTIPTRKTSFILDENIIEELFDTNSEQAALPLTNQSLTTNSILDYFEISEQRRTWYRISRYGTRSKHDAGNDESYVSTPWTKSKIRQDTLAIVARWIAEERSGGISGRDLHSPRSLFNWRDPGLSRAELDGPVMQTSAVNPPLQTVDGNSRNHSRTNSSAPRSAQNSRPSSGIRGAVDGQSGSSAAIQFGWSSSRPSIQVPAPLHGSGQVDKPVSLDMDIVSDLPADNRNTFMNHKVPVLDRSLVADDMSKPTDQLASTTGESCRGVSTEQVLTAESSPQNFSPSKHEDQTRPHAIEFTEFSEFLQGSTGTPQNDLTMLMHDNISLPSRTAASANGTMSSNSPNHVSENLSDSLEWSVTSLATSEVVEPTSISSARPVGLQPAFIPYQITTPAPSQSLHINTSLNRTLAINNDDDDEWGEMVSSPVASATVIPLPVKQPSNLQGTITSSQLDDFFGPSRGHKPKLSLSEEIATTNKVESILGAPALHSPRMSPLRRPNRSPISSKRSSRSDSLSFPPLDIFGIATTSVPRSTTDNRPLRPSRLSVGASSMPDIVSTLDTFPKPLPTVSDTSDLTVVAEQSMGQSTPQKVPAITDINPEDDRIVQEIIRALPDLSYMLIR